MKWFGVAMNFMTGCPILQFGKYINSRLVLLMLKSTKRKIEVENEWTRQLTRICRRDLVIGKEGE